MLSFPHKPGLSQSAHWAQHGQSYHLMKIWHLNGRTQQWQMTKRCALNDSGWEQTLLLEIAWAAFQGLDILYFFQHLECVRAEAKTKSLKMKWLKRSLSFEKQQSTGTVWLHVVIGGPWLPTALPFAFQSHSHGSSSSQKEVSLPGLGGHA
jgi:hypothetical protein